MILNAIAEWFRGWTGYFREDRRRVAVVPFLGLFWGFVAHVVFIGFQAWRFITETGHDPLQEISALREAYVLGTGVPYYGAFVDFVLPAAVTVGVIGFAGIALIAMVIGLVSFIQFMKRAHKEIL